MQNSTKSAANLRVLKSSYVSANPETDFWPEATGYGAGFNPLSVPSLGTLVYNDNPQWHSLTGLHSLFQWFQQNPVFFSIVMIKARAYANMKIVVKNRKTGKVEPENTLKDIPRKLYAMFKNPNVQQSQWEFWMQRKIFEEVAGNSFTYGDFGIGMGYNINTLAPMGLWNVWPAGMEFKLTGKYFGAKKPSDIVKEWQFKAGSYKQTWKPEEILHLNKPNTDYTSGYIFGQSPAVSLYRALTNIDMAYEARNVIMANRGMRGIISSGKGDASGKVALQSSDKEKILKVFKNHNNTGRGRYGFLGGQDQWYVTEQAIQVTIVDQDVNKLGLFDEIATDGILCCNGWGVPEILLKLYLKGATFENQEASERRLYQGTIIPEANNDIAGISSWLELDKTDWMIEPDFSHVACLQESEQKKQDIKKGKSDQHLAEYKEGLITAQEYRDFLEYGPLPAELKPKEDEPTETTEDPDAGGSETGDEDEK